MKLKSINFPNELIRAVRREELVIFAGAGVSMGKPANLPDFPRLAKRVEKKTDQTKATEEPEDRFFGRLQQKGYNVHSLVAGELYTTPGSTTSLHCDLLRLFKNASKVKVVTTNFDKLFEEACLEVFSESAGSYVSPALPLGNDFAGIVHVHGWLDKPKGMVLTDSDFGRAYLTEGWARRFLLAMFRSHMVLFVGYSHNDVVMHYLSRALPAEDSSNRFALVAANDPNLDDWKFRGIRAVPFSKPAKDDYSILNDGVNALAGYVSQSLIDRRKSLLAIASGIPPNDDEEADQIQDALTDKVMTRFVVEVAKKPAWIDWFDKRGYLDSLFMEKNLTVVDELLANWLVDNFILEHDEQLLLLISRHHMNIGLSLWSLIADRIGRNKDVEMDKLALSRWISLLMDTIPRIADEYTFLSLVEHSAKKQDINSLLTIFSALVKHKMEIKEGFWQEEEYPEKIRFGLELANPCDHWCFNEIYEKHIKPLLSQVDIAMSVLSISVRALELRHSSLISWREYDSDFDSDSYGRSAIEPHEQDQIHHPIDVIIDAARDSLVSIGKFDRNLSDSWLDILSKSVSPLVKRLFIYGLNERQDTSPENKLHYFLDRHGLHDINAHHEIYHLIANIYSGLSEAGKAILIGLILDYRWPDTNDERFTERTAREHFDWLQWLVDSDKACNLAKSARDAIVEKYPDFKPSEYPDLTHWMGPVQKGPQSPYTLEQLLGRQASEWVDELLAFKDDSIWRPNIDGLHMMVREAAKKDLLWGLDLAKELGKKSAWETDLWRDLLQAWEEWSPDKNQCIAILGWLGVKELCKHNLYQVTRALQSLVRGGGKACAPLILDDSNITARSLWPEILQDDNIPKSSDNWLQIAVNKPAGILAEYWLDSIQLWIKDQDPKPTILNDTYRGALSEIILTNNKISGLSLTVLASQLAFFFYVDYDWTKAYLIKWFDIDKDPVRFQQSWDGFLSWGRLSPQVAEEMAPYFEKAFSRLDYELKAHRDRFVEYLTALIFFYISDPIEKWVPIFFKYATPDDRKMFASEIERFLGGMGADQQKEYWVHWIKRYWESRLQGLPQPLISDEAAKMAEWVPHLEAVFKEAVDLAIQMPFAEFNHSSIVRDLEKGNVVAQFPESTVKLLIYLLQAKCPSYFWYGIDNILKKLEKEGISIKLLEQLNERLMAVGLSEI